MVYELFDAVDDLHRMMAQRLAEVKATYSKPQEACVAARKHGMDELRSSLKAGFGLPHGVYSLDEAQEFAAVVPVFIKDELIRCVGAATATRTNVMALIGSLGSNEY